MMLRQPALLNPMSNGKQSAQDQSLDILRLKRRVDRIYREEFPHKTGSLVGLTTAQALTVISEIKEVYAYFSLCKNDFLPIQETVYR